MNFFNISFDKIQLNRKNHFLLFFIALFFLTLFMVYCNGSASVHYGYDFYFHYQRLHSLIQALQEGTFPYYTDYSNLEGYGYFTKGFYSDVILIPFAFIGIFTNAFFAYDVMIVVMTLLCGIFTYYALNVIYKCSFTASVGSILYTFAVYRLYDIYQRGALGEALSFTFLPLVFLGLYYIIRGDYRKWYVLAIGFSLLIFTHLIASVLMFITLVILLCVYYKSLINEPRRIYYLFLAGIVTLFIVAYYLFPMLEQIASNSFYFDSRRPGGGAGYGKAPFRLVFWGFLSGLAYPERELWTGIGFLLTIVLFVRFFVKEKKTEALRGADVFVLIGVFYLIAISRIFPWGRFPFSLLGFIQYPWRLYEFVSYFFAVAGAYYLSSVFIKTKSRSIVFMVVVLLTMLTTYINSENFKYLQSIKALQIYEGDSDENPTIANGYHLIGREYLPSKLSDIFYVYQRGLKVENKNIDTKILNLTRQKSVTTFDVNVSQPDTLRLPVLYYLGYTAKLDGQKLPVWQGNEGLLETVIEKSGRVEVYYAGTVIQQLSYYLSMLSVLLLVVYIFIRQRKKKEKNINE